MTSSRPPIADPPPPGSPLFEIDDLDLPISLVQYEVVRHTATILLVKQMERDGRPTRLNAEKRWSRKRIGRSVFGTARAALEAYERSKDAEAQKHRREATRNEEMRDWARDRLAQIGEDPAPVSAPAPASIVEVRTASPDAGSAGSAADQSSGGHSG